MLETVWLLVFLCAPAASDDKLHGTPFQIKQTCADYGSSTKQPWICVPVEREQK